MTNYTQELGDEICFELSQGKSLVRVCRELGAEYRHVFKWIAENPEFKDNYARARESQADYLADDVLDVADNPDIAPDDKRVRIDARKWVAGKMRPKKYGERQSIDLNADINLSTLTDEQLASGIAQAAAEAGIVIDAGRGGEAKEGE